MSSTAAESKAIRSTIPARLDRLELVAVPHAHGRRARGCVDPGRPPDHDRELRDRRPHPARHARHDLEPGGPDRVDLPRRSGDRRARLRTALRPAGSQAPADRHAAPVPVRHRSRRVHGERRRLAVARLLLRHPVDRGDGDRRPVRGDQLRDRRDDALEVPGPRRHLDQRHLLGGGHPRLGRLALLPQRVCARCRLAPRIPDGAGPRDRRDHRGKDAAREPPVAHDSRASGRGGGGATEDRGRRSRVRPGARARRRLAGTRARSREAVRLRHVPGPGLPHIPEAGGPRRDPDDHPVVPVQRHLLHLRTGARPVLRRERGQGAALRPRLRSRQPVRATPARPTLRHRGSEADDLGHIHHLGRAARGQRLALRSGRPHRENADLLLDRHLLLRLRRGERRLPHGQRDVADRDPCRGDRSVLRHRADLRSVRPPVLRCADRRRHQSDGALRRLRRRGSDHGLRRDRRAPHRDQGGRQVARGRHETPDLGLRTYRNGRRQRQKTSTSEMPDTPRASRSRSLSRSSAR